MRFNKTEQELLHTLQTKGRLSFDTSHGKGPSGGKVSHGDRMLNAASSLVKKGLIAKTETDTSRRYQNGYCIHISVHVYKPITKD